jgi:Xaa-Pro dipeptidase
MDKHLAFSLDEYEARLNKVRESMMRQELDVILIYAPENLYYMTGYQTPGYYYKVQTLIIPLEQEPILLVRHHEEPNIYAYSWLENYRVYRDFDDPIFITKQILTDLGISEKSVGVEKASWFLTVRNMEHLQAVMPKVNFKDCSGVVEEVRAVKSPQEVEYIRKAAKITERAMAAGIAATRVGASEEDIAAAVWPELVRGGEYPCFAPFITSGYRTFLTHATWSARRVEKDDVLFYEIGACVERYTAPLARCGLTGQPTDEIASIAQAAITGLTETIKAMKSGATSGQVDEVCKQAMADAGWGGIHLHRSGYSVGIGFPPDWGEGHIVSIQPGDPTVLQSGMVFHIIPSLQVKTAMPIVISDTVLVTDTGGQPLTSFDRELFIR